MKIKLVTLLVVTLPALMALSGSAGAETTVCKGTEKAPGVIVGNTAGNMMVEGVCGVNAGPASVAGEVYLKPGASLLAANGLKGSELDVGGTIHVETGATLILGCDPVGFVCLDDNRSHPTLSADGEVGGEVDADGALAVIMHGAKVMGTVEQDGGGGGVTCQPKGIFYKLENPVFSAYKDVTITGNMEIMNVSTCWIGVVHSSMTGMAPFANNKALDPDAMEVLENTITGNLECTGNSAVWDSEPTGPTEYPRRSRPNKVTGTRTGQCVTASPIQEGVPGKGPF